MADQGFPKSARLLKSADFDRVFGQRCSATDDSIVVYAARNGREHCRLGMTVSRKVGNAVARNRWKRLLREAFRLTQHELPRGVDLVVLPRSGAVPQLSVLLAALPKLAERLARKLGDSAESQESS